MINNTFDIKILIFIALYGSVLGYFLYRKGKKAYSRLTEKKKGYIISVRNCDYYGSIRVFVDGKVYDVHRINKDAFFYNLYNSFSSRYSCDFDILVQGIPIDVYVVGNEAFPDYSSLGGF